MAATTSSAIMPQPLGKRWTTLTGQGLAMSKKRNKIKIAGAPSSHPQFSNEKTAAIPACDWRQPSVQPRPAIGTARISSSTMQPGSRSLRIFSASEHTQTPTQRERPIMPSVQPKPEIEYKTTIHSRPSREPQVPGALGIRPAPNPNAKHKMILSLTNKEQRTTHRPNKAFGCAINTQCRNKASAILQPISPKRQTNAPKARRQLPNRILLLQPRPTANNCAWSESK